MTMHRVEIYRPGGRNRDSNPEINIIPPVEASKLDGVSFPLDARVIQERGPNGPQVGKIVLSGGTDVIEHENLRRAVFNSIGSGVMSSGRIYTSSRPH